MHVIREKPTVPETYGVFSRFPWGIFQLSIDRFPALKKDKTAFCPRVTAEGRPREFKEFEI